MAIGYKIHTFEIAKRNCVGNWQCSLLMSKDLISYFSNNWALYCYRNIKSDQGVLLLFASKYFFVFGVLSIKRFQRIEFLPYILICTSDLSEILIARKGHFFCCSLSARAWWKAGAKWKFGAFVDCTKKKFLWSERDWVPQKRGQSSLFKAVAGILNCLFLAVWKLTIWPINLPYLWGAACILYRGSCICFKEGNFKMKKIGMLQVRKVEFF
jgi:hypothetical protein